MNRTNWFTLIIIILVLIIVLIAAVYLSNCNIRTNVENFVESINGNGIKSLIEEYSTNSESKGQKTVIYENTIGKVENISDLADMNVVDISVPEIPRAFLRDTSINFESSGIRRTKPERLCKKVLERIYGKKFSRVRPSWLRNPKTGRPLELDCYNEELGIALEYNGIAHYKWPNWTKMTKKEFLDQVERDRFKLDACDEHGVYLIVVPYNIPENLIPDFIEYQLPHNVQRRREMQESGGY